MPLEINAQFNQFVQFAQDQANPATSKAIARMGVDGPLGGRAIKASERREGDSVRPFLPRSTANKNANDAVRSLFRQSIASMFGGENRIPPSVKEAMRLQDYGEGRPLTARRIMAVEAAVDKVLGRVAPALERAMAKAGGLYAPRGNESAEERRNRIDGLLDTLVGATAGDPDALDVAVSTARDILQGGDAVLRTPDQVRQKAERLLADVAGLRTLAGGNRAVFEAGKSFLVAMNGKAPPEGFLRDMLNATARLKIDRIKSLSASSSDLSVHKAVRQFSDDIEKAMLSTGALRKFQGADEVRAAENLAAGLLLARCGEGTARRIAAATTGRTASLVYSFYTEVSTGRFQRPEASDGQKAHTRLQGTLMGSRMEVLNQVSQIRFGTAPTAVRSIPNAPRNANYNEDIDGAEIFEFLEDQALEASEKEQAGFVRNAVAGDGPQADKIRSVYARFGGPVPQNSAFKLQTARNTILRNMVNLHFCEERKVLSGGNHENSQFALDRARGMVVRLPNGAQLSGDFGTARDELAAFVTRGAKADYASLDDAEKGKVHVLMALLNQKTAMAAMNAEPLALDPHGRDTQLTVAGEPNREFEISFTRNGSLKVDCKIVREPLPSIDVADGKGRYETLENLGAGSKVEASFSLEIAPQELDRLATADYSKYDDARTSQHVLDPNAERPYETVRQVLDQDFRFASDNDAVTCRTGYKITIA